MVRKVHKYADGGKVVKQRPPVTAKDVSSPGVTGAIKDAIGALGKATAPKSITQRKGRLDKAIEEAGG
jgi:hypothetical protein